MSVVPSISTVLSLLSFLTTVFALARVGAAAFSANQQQHSGFSSTPGPFQIPLVNSGGSGMSLSQALQFGAGDKKKDVGDDVLGYIGGHELVRMPSSNWSSVRKPLLFRPPSPFLNQQKPLSMAKLIMSRHQSQRKPSRPSPVRRPPGLMGSFSSRSGLVQEVV